MVPGARAVHPARRGRLVRALDHARLGTRASRRLRGNGDLLSFFILCQRRKHSCFAIHGPARFVQHARGSLLVRRLGMVDAESELPLAPARTSARCLALADPPPRAMAGTARRAAHVERASRFRDGARHH